MVVERMVELETPIELGRFLLTVRSDSTVGSDHLLKIKLINEDRTWKSIQIKYSEPMTYMIGTCTNFQYFSAQPHLQHQNDWLFTQTPKGIIIMCNQETVVDLELSDEVCSSSYAENLDWKTSWSKRIIAVSFDKLDTASEFYNFEFEMGKPIFTFL